MAENNRVDEHIAEWDAHARLLRAVHREFLDHGLVLVQDHHQQHHEECPRLIQSSAGAFPPLRYVDHVGGGGAGGRAVVVRALAMFDDLIVNATAGAFGGDGDGDGDGEVRRRIKLNVMTWLPLICAGGGEEAGVAVAAAAAAAATAATGAAAVAGVGDREVPEHLRWQGHQRDGQAAPPVTAGVAAAAAAAAGGGEGAGARAGAGAGAGAGANFDHKTSAGGKIHRHTYTIPASVPRPSPGGATAALATTSTSPASPLRSLREAFRSRVLSGLLLHLCPPPGPFADLFGCGDELRQRILGMLGARDLATFGLTSRSAAVSAVSNPLWAPLLSADFSESEQREGVATTLPPCSSLDRPYHQRKRGRSTSGGGGSGGGDGDETTQEEGRLWRCYGELERRRKKREAERKAQAQERSRAMQLMAFMGRRSRAPYPAGLPCGPYHTPGPPMFPGYDWGPGIGDNAGVSPLSPPSPMWGRGGWPAPLRGWGRAPWRR